MSPEVFLTLVRWDLIKELPLYINEVASEHVALNTYQE